MDNNFSKILETFKSLNETFNRDNIVIDGKQVNLNTIQIDGINTNDYPDFVDAYIGNASFVDGTPLSDDQCLALSQNYPQIVSDNIQDQLIDAGDAMHDAYKHGEIGEGSMASAEQHSTGPKFTGYWKGTDSRTPGQHMVGGADESVEECGEPVSLIDKLRARWAETKRETGLDEAGANNPAPGAQDPIQQKAMLQKTTQAGQTFQKLQNMAGIKTGVGASQAAKTAVANTQNPNINPSTGAGMDQTGKKVIGALGKGIEDALVNANPADATKLIQNIQQIKQKAAGQ
jgi:hypothetical protein